MKSVKAIRFEDDGTLIIETNENGLDCFYALLTKEGDFKAIWGNDGKLTREIIETTSSLRQQVQYLQQDLKQLKEKYFE